LTMSASMSGRGSVLICHSEPGRRRGEEPAFRPRRTAEVKLGHHSGRAAFDRFPSPAL
jgi:hypothetical protein